MFCLSQYFVLNVNKYKKQIVKILSINSLNKPIYLALGFVCLILSFIGGLVISFKLVLSELLTLVFILTLVESCLIIKQYNEPTTHNYHCNRVKQNSIILTLNME